jgi:hypothetical protein
VPADDDNVGATRLFDFAGAQFCFFAIYEDSPITAPFVCEATQWCR